MQFCGVLRDRGKRQVASGGEMSHLQRRGVATDDFSIGASHCIRDFAKGRIVPDQKGDGQVFIHGCAQFSGRELQAAITNQADNRRAGGCHGSAYGGTGTKAQRAKASGRIKPAPRAVMIVVKITGIDGLGAVAHDQRLWQRTSDGFDHLKLGGHGG